MDPAARNHTRTIPAEPSLPTSFRSLPSKMIVPSEGVQAEDGFHQAGFSTTTFTHTAIASPRCRSKLTPSPHAQNLHVQIRTGAAQTRRVNHECSSRRQSSWLPAGPDQPRLVLSLPLSLLSLQTFSTPVLFPISLGGEIWCLGRDRPKTPKFPDLSLPPSGGRGQGMGYPP